MTSLKLAVVLALAALLTVACGTPVAKTSPIAVKSSTLKTPVPKRSHGHAHHRRPGHSPNRHARHRPSTPSSLSYTCSTNSADGSCGPYDDPQITGTTSATNVGNNVWHPIRGWAQTLNVADASNWFVKVNLPASNTAVVSFPSVGANYGQESNTPTPLSDFSAIHSSFSESMNATSETRAWAMYDVWLGQGTSSAWTHEVMIQYDFANNGYCAPVATATFGGYEGVPKQKWNLCSFGSSMAWKLPRDEHASSVDILEMLQWLVNHRYLPQDAGLWTVGMGWEICSTGGQNENFEVNKFSISAPHS
jgi:hypothetical protein